jgi:hypothetical protein
MPTSIALESGSGGSDDELIQREQLKHRWEARQGRLQDIRTKAAVEGQRTMAKPQRRQTDNLVTMPSVNPLATVEHLLNRIRAEFMEMPSLRLTAEQVQRLCGVERTICESVLGALVDAKFLCEKSDGAYALLTDGDIGRPRPAKAELATKRHSVKASSKTAATGVEHQVKCTPDGDRIPSRKAMLSAKSPASA